MHLNVMYYYFYYFVLLINKLLYHITLPPVYQYIVTLHDILIRTSISLLLFEIHSRHPFTQSWRIYLFNIERITCVVLKSGVAEDLLRYTLSWSGNASFLLLSFSHSIHKLSH
jgi:hypothetical protein